MGKKFFGRWKRKHLNWNWLAHWAECFPLSHRIHFNPGEDWIESDFEYQMKFPFNLRWGAFLSGQMWRGESASSSEKRMPWLWRRCNLWLFVPTSDYWSLFLCSCLLLLFLWLPFSLLFYFFTSFARAATRKRSNNKQHTAAAKPRVEVELLCVAAKNIG